MFSSNTSQVSSGGYEIQRSLRFNSADSAFLNRTPASASNRRTWTWSGWVKRSALTGEQAIFGRSNSAGSVHTGFIFQSNNTIQFFSDNSGGYAKLELITTPVFRDPSAFYHLVFVLDTTQATAANRARIFVNGVQVTSFTTADYPNQNDEYQINTTNPHGIGRYFEFSGNHFFNGYMTEVNFIDGQALTPSSFGAFDAQTGVWGPTRYAGSYGTNGFYLNFSDNSNTTAATLGRDYSGNSNNWTPNNFSVAAGAGNDLLVDVPTNFGVDTGVGGSVRGNYCTLNPLDKSTAGGSTNNGNLGYAATQESWDMIRSTFGIASGKWYWEVSVNSSSFGITGIAQSSVVLQNNFFNSGACLGYNASNGDKYSGLGGASSYGASWNASNDICGVALDMDAGTLTFYKNGTSQGVAFTGLTGTYFPTHTLYLSGSTATMNFGQRPFAYTAPSGFRALNTQNLPTPTIGATTATQAGKFFNPVLYTGNGSTQNITGVGFQPDWVWLKSRSNATDNELIDVLRGATNALVSNSTAAATTDANGLTAFASDGFALGTDANYNGSGRSFVAWNWKANGAGVTNTAGSITSTVSANTTSGFSVVTYTGTGANATVGHGLGAAPRFIIIKGRSGTTGWPVYSASVGNTRFGYLNTTDFFDVNSTAWNNTSPTSSVFTIGTGGLMNTSAATYVAYCFAEVPGYSRFGSYVGNSSSDGPFVFCGFRPAYVMVKLSSSGGTADWIVEDGTRNPSNVVNAKLSPNTSGAEFVDASAIGIDFLSNGFKIRGTDGAVNTANTYIFAAFASAPQKFALAR